MIDAGPYLIGSSGDTLREAFGKALVERAEEFQNLVVLDGDVAGGTGTHHFRREFPDRFLQFGIAEQNMMGAAAGLALTGFLPVVTTFAVFALRAVEQLRQSIAVPGLNVKLVASHPGLDAGEDGASAQAIEDLAVFRAIPNLTVVTPCDVRETRLATREILAWVGPVYMRTGRSPAPLVTNEGATFEIGKGTVMREGADVTIVACGVQVGRALEAATSLSSENIRATVVNMATIKPIDVELLVACADTTGAVVVSEDHNVLGGLGGAVAEALGRHRPCPLAFVGVQDVFGESGPPDALAEKYELDAGAIVRAARTLLDEKRN